MEIKNKQTNCLFELNSTESSNPVSKKKENKLGKTGGLISTQHDAAFWKETVQSGV